MVGRAHGIEQYPMGALFPSVPRQAWVRGNTGVTEFGMDNAGSIAVRITLAPSGHRGGGGEKNWGTGRREDFERVWGERECSDAVEVGKGRVVRRWTQSGSHSIV